MSVERTGTAITKRAKPAKPAVRRVTFADRGQEFRQWDLDEDGIVIQSLPGGLIWLGVRVLNHQGLRHGAELQLRLSDGSQTMLAHRADMVAKLAQPERRVA
jgi:hypothetical protein